MRLKAKALGFGILATVAVGLMAATTASAEQNPLAHFTSDSVNNTTKITGTQSGTHTIEVVVPGLTGIVCDSAQFDGTMVANTVTEIALTPTLNSCKTTGGTAGETVLDHEGCNYILTIGKKSTADNTVDLSCPIGKSMTITHPNCVIKGPAQNGGSGAAYTTMFENGKHTLTVDFTLKLTTHFEAGACVLLGTTKTCEFKGSITLEGFEDVGGQEGARINLTATGPEG